ncbi:MAG: beta-ketoacyl-ACP synthase II [Candidatus Omnitrophica bacterium]|nr:beta-ketoacyl-ACP synthase II [Candidatus Omnitrophota bacterium]
MEKHRVVITGLGILAPNGNSVDEFWASNIKGRSGIAVLERFDRDLVKVRIAGEIKKFEPENFMDKRTVRKVDRFAHLGIAASGQAVKNSGLNGQISQSRTGVIIGTGMGNLVYHEDLIMEFTNSLKKKTEWIPSSTIPRGAPNSVTSYIAMMFSIKGPNLALSTACSSGTNAIGLAFQMLRGGLLDICITGGVEAPLSPVTFAGYQNLRVLSRREGDPAKASRPFDKERDGFVISEGAATLILETEEHAIKRGADIWAEISGFGTNCGAFDMVMPDPEGNDAAEAMKIALGDACLHISDIDYINAHGTSTLLNDVAETKAIKKVFEARAHDIPISATKSMIGHSIGAAGAIEALVCALAVKNQEIPPTINYENKDPDCDLDYVPNYSRKIHLRHAMSNSFGFGSNNAVLIISSYGKSA